MSPLCSAWLWRKPFPASASTIWFPPAGGRSIADRDVTPEERRSVIRFLAEAAEELRGQNIEILTTDSPMDGAFLMEILKDDPRREEVRKLLANAGGCSTK